MKITEYLKDHHVPFQTMHHAPTFTASRMAETLHVTGQEVAKPVLLRTGRGYVLVVVPSNRFVDLQRIREWMGDVPVEMASEEEMEQIFPNCEPGAMPPFGSIYRVNTLVDDSLAEDDEIVFQAGNHEDAIRMSYHDYEEMEHPIRGDFAYHASTV